MMMRFNRLNRFLLSVVLLIGIMGFIVPNRSEAQAICPLDFAKPQKVKSLDVLKAIPVLHDGRVKPFDTFARSFLLLLSGRQHYQKEEASEWMARFLFAPRTTNNDKIFLINNSEILEALKVDPEKSRRYSFNQINQGYDKLKELVDGLRDINEKNLSVVDRELLRVYSNFIFYNRLSGAFAFAVPHPDFTFTSPETIAQLQLPALETNMKYYSLFDVLERSENLTRLSKAIEAKSVNQWSDSDKEIARTANALSFWTEHYSDCPLGLIPTQSVENEEWLSPMDTLITGFFLPAYHEEIKNLRNMAIAYWNGTQFEFDLAGKAFVEAESKLLSQKERIAVEKISLELIYNKLSLFLWAKIFYGIGFIFFLLSLMSEKKWMYKFSVVLTIFGFIPHLLALILRVLIMSRPPVSNLFETFVFVGIICVVLGLILELINKNWLGIVVANVCGFILLIIAGKFSADGDTMQMLVAVLDSNFWLSTHVIAISIGYAGCCVAGIMGHIYILQALSKNQSSNRLEVTYKNMLGILGFGLTLTFLGTTLGGIWADQSWGRFWGWDPKENGALMIVIWCAIIFHARLAKVINPLGVAVGCILALMNVMWAWFGVNLLSVGLHSYGFTSGIANSLMIYVIIEVIFIATTVIILGKRNVKI